MAGTLYLCATPIGNLEDMTFRVIRTLKEVDLIAAEDTRNSIKLLNHFEIKTPMTSYHEYNKIEKGHKLVERLQGGENIAVITDAGMPGISDPGEELVKMCQEAGVKMTPAGATYPYGKDPHDSNIRIAPTFPSLTELIEATKIFILCVKLVSVDKLIG